MSLIGLPGGRRMPEMALKLDSLHGGIYGYGASGSGNPLMKSREHGIKEEDMLLLYRLQAEAGDPSALYLLGFYHYFGSDSLEINYHKAFTYFRKAAKQYPENIDFGKDGETNEIRQAKFAAASAAGYLGQMYWRGEGVEVNEETGRKWFERGISQNNPASFTYMGLMHQEGAGGLEKNAATGMELIKKGAEKGNSLGKVLLAEHYLSK